MGGGGFSHSTGERTNEEEVGEGWEGRMEGRKERGGEGRGRVKGKRGDPVGEPN